MKPYQTFTAKAGNQTRSAFLTLMFPLFFLILGYSNKAVAADVTVNAAQTFAALDASDGSTDGVFTVTGNLTITGTGSITGNPTGGKHMKFQISGDLVIEIGGLISGNVTSTNQKGDSITVWAQNITLKGNGINGGKITSNQPTGVSCNGGKGGNIYLNATASTPTAFIMENGSVVSANASCSAGDIVILAPNSKIEIDGLVESKSTITGTGANQAPGGGPITVIGSCELLINNNGRLISQGIDAGADLIHLEACVVKVFGLVSSSGTGHGTPNNPKTSLVPPYRPDKPTNSTAGVEIWGNEITIDKTSGHKGEVNATTGGPGGSSGTSWIDIFGRTSVIILGATTGNFAVRANGLAGTNDNGGLINVRSSEGTVTAAGWAIQANALGSGGKGGRDSILAKLDINLNNAKIEARGAVTGGAPEGGQVYVKSFGDLPGSGNIIADGITNINVTGKSTPNGVVELIACGAVGFPAGTVTPAAIAPAITLGVCGSNPTLPAYVVLPAVDCRDRCIGDQPCPCVICDGVVVVNQNVTINFNTAVPTYSGDPDLQPYFTYSKVGVDPSKWYAIFNLGGKKLEVLNGATITTSTVSGAAPGLEFNSTCSLEVKTGGTIKVVSANKNTGDIVFNINGDVVLNGTVTNQVTGTLGIPGKITGTSICGKIDVAGLVQILGVDNGGNTISLVTCESTCPPPSGQINITGLVKSYAHAHGGDLTLNRPNIRVISFTSGITINANTAEPLYDEFSVGGGLYDIYGGLLSWTSTNSNPGKVEVQAKGDIIVNGHGTDPTGPVRKSFGALAAIATASSAPGGLVDVRSLEGKIVGNDRAFDVKGRNRLAAGVFARINLYAKNNVELNRLGANDNFNPVCDASGVGAGDLGGKNDIRSFTGSVNVNTNAIVTSAALGTNGTNGVTHCTGFTNNGTVTQPPTVVLNCADAAPLPLYLTCDLSPRPGRNNSATTPAIVGNNIFIRNYPNPFTSTTTIEFNLPTAGKTKLSVFDASGREIKVLVNGTRPAGSHTVEFSSNGLSRGIYYYKLEAGENSEMNKMMIK